MGVDAQALENKTRAGSKINYNQNTQAFSSLLFKDKIHREDEKDKTDKVIHPECFILKKYHRKNNEYRKGDYFLDHF